MLFSKSTVVALLSVIAVAAEVPSPSIPDWIGAKPSGKAVYATDDFTIPGSRFTLAPTVTALAMVHPTTMPGDIDPVMPDHTPQPSLILTATTTGSRAPPRNSQNLSKTGWANGTFTGSPVVSIVTSNVTIIRHTGTATLGNGTNRTTSATLTPMPTSPGSTITPYGAALLVVLVGFAAMGL